MRIVKTAAEMSKVSAGLKKQGRTIGFVPTMGFLHKGHLSLIAKARRENDIVVVSIFVNPTQFTAGEDYKKYPRNIRRDIVLAKTGGCDILFCPTARDMYPNGCRSYVDVRELTRVMCGKSRPTHFTGVCSVCAKLFNIIRPDIAYFGQKDYQQAVIIQRMVKDLNMDFTVKICPIVREESGLAMSSRNNYLSAQQKKDATVLYKALKQAKLLIRGGEKRASEIKTAMRRVIMKRPGIRLDYITIANPEALAEQSMVRRRVLVALAAWVGRTRLIDNMLVDPR